MRQSVAVKQPSLFEGWSTSVEEVKSLGKTIILSDLAVHREQAPPAAFFFKRNDASSLAEQLGAVWDNTKAGPDEALERSARSALPIRTKEFGQNFLRVFQEAIAS